MDFPVILAPFVEKTILSPFAPLSKISYPYIYGFISKLCIISVPLICLFIFTPIPCCFDYCSFIISLEIH